MQTQSTHLKNAASTAKRVSSTLTSLANQGDLSIADRGVLLTAANIVASIAIKNGIDARTAKANEDKYNRDYKAALARISPAIKALPCQTIPEKVAIACLRNHFSGYLTKGLLQPTLREIQWELDYYTETSISDSAASAAYWVATGKGSVEQAIKDLQGKHQEVTNDARVIELAARFVKALEPAMQVAA